MKEEILTLYGRMQRRFRWMQGVDLFLEFAFLLSVPLAGILLLDRALFELDWSRNVLSSWGLPLMAGGLLFSFLISLVIILFQPVSPHAIATLVDRAVQGEERFLSALEIAQTGGTGCFHSLVLADAARLSIQPARIFRWPKIRYRWGTGVALGAAVVLHSFPPLIAPPPVAAFSVSAEEGPAPLTIECVSHHQGLVDRVAWDFGDGRKAEGTSVSHRYSEPGRYRLRLLVTGPGGSAEAFKEIRVVPRRNPWSHFEFYPEKGRAPLLVTFQNRSRNADSFQWSFGDGISSREENPSYLFSRPGTYTITLKTINKGGEHQSSKTLRVLTPEAPLSDFRAFPRKGEAPLQVAFENLSTGKINSSEWDFGDPYAASEGISRDRNPVHQFRFPGTYTITLVSRGPGGEDVEKKEAYIQVGESGGGGGSGGANPRPRPRTGPQNEKSSAGEEGRLFGERSKPKKINIEPVLVPSESRESEKVDRDRWVWSEDKNSSEKKEGRELRELFPEYERGVEKTMGKEKVPPSVRDYVKKYFEQIRPR